MFNLHDIIVFLAGAQFFHTISHIFIAYFFDFPLRTKIMMVSKSLNFWAIIINGAITVLLLWLATKV